MQMKTFGASDALRSATWAARRGAAQRNAKRDAAHNVTRSVAPCSADVAKFCTAVLEVVPRFALLDAIRSCRRTHCDATRARERRGFCRPVRSVVVGGIVPLR